MQKIVFVDVGDYKVDFIYMFDNGNFWIFIFFMGNKAVQIIEGDFIYVRFQCVYQNVVNFLFIVVDGVGFV